MTDFHDLNSIMDSLREDDSHVVTHEQREDVHRGEQDQLTDLQEDLMEWRQLEEKQADREPQVRREAI